MFNDATNIGSVSHFCFEDLHLRNDSQPVCAAFGRNYLRNKTGQDTDVLQIILVAGILVKQLANLPIGLADQLVVLIRKHGNHLRTIRIFLHTYDINLFC